MGNLRPLAQAADHAATHQQLFAAVHLSSMSAVERLRDTLRSEHSFAFQVRFLIALICLTSAQTRGKSAAVIVKLAVRSFASLRYLSAVMPNVVAMPVLRSAASRVQFMVTLWRRVMTPFQAARISVTAYPIIQVDMLAVVKCASTARVTATHTMRHDKLPSERCNGTLCDQRCRSRAGNLFAPSIRSSYCPIVVDYLRPLGWRPTENDPS